METKKAVPQDVIPIKILKLNNDKFSQNVSQIFNKSIEAGNFLNELRYTYIIPAYHKKGIQFSTLIDCNVWKMEEKSR